MMQRWKRYSVALLMFFLASIARGQSTTVSVTVVDTNSQAWAGGTISYQFRPNPSFPTEQYVWNGSNLPAQYLVPTQVNLDGSGHASFTIPSNAFIVPAGSTWTFVVCPNASISCTTVFAAVAGSSIDLSSTINAALPPNGIVMSPTNIPKAYQDSEVKTVVQFGGVYYNTTTGCYRFWNGSTWTSLCGGGPALSCPSSSVAANSVLYSPSGTNCTGDGNFIYTRTGLQGVILNGAQDGHETNLLIEAQHDNTGGVGSNNTLFSGHGMSIFFDGGGADVDPGLVGSDVEGNDANSNGDLSDVLTGYQAILGVTVAGRQVTGYEAAINMNAGSGKAGTIQGFQVDDDPIVQSTNFYGYRAKLLGADATGDDFAFYAEDIAKINIQSNFCDFYTTSSDSILRVKLGCGQNSTNELGGNTTVDGEVDINGATGVAGGSAMRQGTSPNSGAPPAGYVGWSAPTTVTNNYWAPLPGTFPGSGTYVLSFSGTSSPLTTAWTAFNSPSNRTCNSNGCFVQYADGTLEQWGVSSPVVTGGGNLSGTSAITFPTPFTTTTNLSVILTSDGCPNSSDCSSSNQSNLVTTMVNGSLSTSGFTGYIGTATVVGGGGASITATIHIHWHAWGN